MENTSLSYNIDGWYIQLPQDWKFSLDKNQQPPQIVFDANELVNVYISTWDWKKRETGEKASAKEVASFFTAACDLQGYGKTDRFADYYPEGFVTYAAQGVTDDDCAMLTFGICTAGSMLSIYFIGVQGIDLTAYVSYIKTVERDQT